MLLLIRREDIIAGTKKRTPLISWREKIVAGEVLLELRGGGSILK